jgi:antitoxin (DNA-binding transcriptional repressor) of toxin-antitoxin stability system
MAVIHISEAEAVRDFATLLAHVRAGTEVIIESELAPVAVLVPPADQTAEPGPDHDTWFRSQVQQALDDTHSDTSDEAIEAHFAQRRAASLLKSTGKAGRS